MPTSQELPAIVEAQQAATSKPQPGAPLNQICDEALLQSSVWNLRRSAKSACGTETQISRITARFRVPGRGLTILSRNH